MRARPLVLAAAVATALTLVGCGSAAHSGSADGAHASSAETTSRAGAADISFAQLMIPHHEQAVAMSELALRKASTPAVKDLATRIKAAQAPEIAQLQAWLADWGAPQTMEGATLSTVGGHDMGEMDMSGHDMGGLTMSGMMSDEDMERLAAATGKDFDRLWLGMMIAHHEGAVEMARQVRGATGHVDVRRLADAIITGQTEEIATMKRLVDA